MGTVAKLHHTVPKFYLRGFADEGERIMTVRLPGDRRFTQSINKTAATNHFYSIEGHPDGADAFEKALSEVERETAPVFRSIADGVWPLPLEQRVRLGYFIALQAVRGPDHRRNIGHLMAQTTRIEAELSGPDGAQEWIRDRFGIEVDKKQAAEVWERATRPSKPLVVPPPLHIDQIATMAEELVKFVIGRPWTLVRFERRSLVTRDAPVGLVPGPDHDPWRGVGFLTAWGITFPLSRKLGLVMSDATPLAEAQIPVESVHDGEFDSAEPGSAAEERFINWSTVRTAGECVYLHPDDERFLPDPLPKATLTTIHVSGQKASG
ncbi:DUF4238 domain-containing protein [Nocardia amikacinitolerans]|uniref:DUF4238 domain-containing protein n=1 Tax=Nocardia amikacinitolerans TaxID=756689 RepID=UPI00367689C6